MYPVFRLIKSIYRGRKESPIEFDEALTQPYRVLPTDIDFNLHLNDSKYIVLCNFGRIEYLMRTGLSKLYFNNKWRAVVGGTSIRYQNEILPFEKFYLRTRLLCWDERWFFFEHRFLKSDFSHSATAIARTLFLSKKGAVPTKIVFEKINVNVHNFPKPEAIKDWLSSDNAFKKLADDHPSNLS